jgi:hypothetical protein
MKELKKFFFTEFHWESVESQDFNIVQQAQSHQS